MNSKNSSLMGLLYMHAAKTILQKYPFFVPVVVSVSVFGIALGLYTTTAIPGLIVGGGIESESAELQRAANRLGIAHSTGYPLYTMLGYLAARLGETLDQNPHSWITYTSSFTAAISVALFFLLALEVSHVPVAAVAATLLIVTDTMWHVGTIAETQGLHAISIVGILWLSAVHLKHGERFWPLAGLAFLAGLGLANHRTIVLTFPSAGLAVLLTGAWRRLKLRQWGILIALVLIPVTSYGYMFWRAADPHVVYSVRLTRFPAELDSGDVGDIIRGTLQDGHGMEGNITLPIDDTRERLRFVWNNLQQDVETGGTNLPTEATVVAGFIGLMLLARRNWRLGLVLGVHMLIWTVFLMSWRLDWKATIYQHILIAPLVLGLAALCAWPLAFLAERLPAVRRPPLALLVSMPLVFLVVVVYADNHPIRDLSDDTRGEQYYKKTAALPPNSVVYTGGWSAETFIMLEYIDDSGRDDILPTAERWHEALIEDALQTDHNVFLSPFMRGLYGLYAGRVWLQEEVAFSGTYSDIRTLSGASDMLFIQARPKKDPRLKSEADAGQVVKVDIAPGVRLYSYALKPKREGLQIGLYWRATESVDTTYSVYTHLRHYSPDNTVLSLLAQDDAFAPVSSTYPTTVWTPGELVKDTYLIPWPASPLPSSGVTLTIGMTVSATGERMQEFSLPLQSEDGYPVDFAGIGVKVSQ